MSQNEEKSRIRSIDTKVRRVQGVWFKKFNDDKSNCLDWSSVTTEEVEGGNKSEHVMTWLFVAKTKSLCLWGGMYALTDSLLQIHICQVSNENQ